VRGGNPRLYATASRGCTLRVLSASLEELIKEVVNARIQWILAKDDELKTEGMRLEEMKREIGGDREDGAAIKCRVHDDGERFVKVFRLSLRFLLIGYPVG